MDFIYQLLPENILYALGWTVVHSLWQAFVAALLLSAYLLGWQKADVRKRYIAGNVALASILLAAVVTFTILLENSSPVLEREDAIFSDNGQLLGWMLIERSPSVFSEYFNENMPLIVTFWLVGLVFFLLKMVGGLIYIQRLRHRYVTPLPRQWQETLGMLAGELNLHHPVQLAESALVKVPLVIGWLKPVILMPVGAVNHLTTEQVEAILAHELAHITRHDYLFNLLQSVIESLFYFNPAVWWISANVRTERENCCDDLAVQLCGSSLAYAKALVSLQEIHDAAPAFAMPFSKNKNQLLTRIQRILQPSQNKSNVMEKLSATLLLLAAILLLSVQAKTPFGNLLEQVISNQSVDEFSYAPVEDPMLFVYADTIPGGQETHIHRKTDGEEVELFMKNGEITNLIVNGEEIPKDRFGEFEDLVSQLREEVENIPEPPAPPAPPTPPAPPGFRSAPTPPAPPAPPAPPSGTRRIITQKDGKSTTFIIEPGDGSEPVEIRMKDGKKGEIIINGQEISGLKNGEKTIIVEEVERAPHAWFWNGATFDVMPELAFETPHFSPDDFHFDMPAPEVFDFNFQDDKTWEKKARLFEEMAQRMKQGQLNGEWLDEMRERLGEDAVIAPHLLELDELRARTDEERARNFERQQEHYQQQMERQQEQMERMQQHQQELQRLMEERMQLKLEKEQQLLEKRRTKKRLIANDGSM